MSCPQQLPRRSPMQAEVAPVKLDLVGPAFKANPYPTYARLRHESPIAPTRLPDGRQAWLITRYYDCARALKDARFSKDRRRVSTPHLLPMEWLFGPMIRSLQF